MGVKAESKGPCCGIYLKAASGLIWCQWADEIVYICLGIFKPHLSTGDLVLESVEQEKAKIEAC